MDEWAWKEGLEGYRLGHLLVSELGRHLRGPMLDILRKHGLDWAGVSI